MCDGWFRVMSNKAKHILLLLAGGVLIPSLILGFALLLDVGLGLEPLATPFYWIVGWSMYVFTEIFPGKNPLYPDEVTTIAFAAMLLCDVLIFSLLAGSVLKWRERKRLQSSPLPLNTV